MGAKILYNLKGIGRMLIPRAIPQHFLESKIAEIFTFDQATLDSIAMRVSHYYQSNTRFHPKPFTLPPTKPDRLALVPPHYGYLRGNKLSKLHSSVYFYDSYQWTRYFPDHFAWNYEFGDVNYYLTSPTITKTRPIHARQASIARDEHAKHSGLADASDLPNHPTMPQNPINATSQAIPHTNNILLQLDKHRHFSFIKDPIPYEKKRDLLFFRGACPQEHRSRFLHQYFSHPLCDLGHTGGASEHPAYTKPKIPKQEHLHYKFLLSLEGNDVASNLKWILGSNCLCIMPKPRYESWFMEECLQANVHYALLDDDYSNLSSLLEFFIHNTKAAKEIIHNANAYCQAFQNPRIEAACNLLVLRKYFYLSDQGDLSPNERALLGF